MSELIEGIDVSRHQGRIDWRQVAASGVRFAWIKATEGSTWIDPFFHRNREEASEAGLVTGAYHYAKTGDPTRQARHLLATAGVPQPGELPLALDLEEGVGMSPAHFAIRFLETLESAGARCVLYTYLSYWRQHLQDTVTLRRYPLWLARYGPDPGLDHWTVWQYTSSGTVPGITGRVDRNRFRGGEAELARFIGLFEEGSRDMTYQLVQRRGEAAVYVTDGVRLVRSVPNPRIRDILVFSLGPVKVIDDKEFWDWLVAGGAPK